MLKWGFELNGELTFVRGLNPEGIAAGVKPIR